jgi:peptide-methionine (R)-S-oxide reductase
LSDDGWRKKLTAEQYRVLRQQGTEAPFSGEHLKESRQGTFACSGCGKQLFSSDAKFDSGCGWPARFIGAYEKQFLRKSLSELLHGPYSLGWPSFDRPMSADSVEERIDTCHFMVRTEVRCPDCGGHLGHVFNDGPMVTGKRYCINSVALKFRPDK